MRRKILLCLLFIIFSFSSFGQLRNAFKISDEPGKQVWAIRCQSDPQSILREIYGDFPAFLANPNRTSGINGLRLSTNQLFNISPERSESTNQSGGRTRYVIENFNQLSHLIAATGDPSSPLACTTPGSTILVEIIPPEPVVVVPPEELRISRYAQSDEVARMIEVLRANARHKLRRVGANGARARRVRGKNSSRPTGYCYRYVKFGLKQGGLTRSSRRDPEGYLTGNRARNAGPALERQGFVNIMQEPFNVTSIADAPKGAVLVFTGGASGHIEVKAGDNEFISDFIDDQPISHSSNLGRARRLTGIYIK